MDALLWMLVGAGCMICCGLALLKLARQKVRGLIYRLGILSVPQARTFETSAQYYGTSQVDQISFLEFGSQVIGSAQRHVWGSWWHQDAYDGYMVPRYLKDLLLYRDVLDSGEPSLTLFVEKAMATAHADLATLILKYAAINAAHDRQFGGGRLRFCELGSTLFGAIDEMRALDRAAANGALADYISRGRYVGYELSRVQNRLAEALHPGTEFELYSEGCAADYIAHGASYDVFYSISISMTYALRSAEDLARLCQPARLSILSGVCLALYETQSVPLGTGKYGYDPGLEAFMRALKQRPEISVVFQPATTVLYPPGLSPGTVRVGTQNRNRLPVLATSLAIGSKEDVETFQAHYRALTEKLRPVTRLSLPARLDAWLPLDELLEPLKTARLDGGALTYNALTIAR